MKCPVCGTDNETGAAFCYRCGSSLNPGTPAVGRTVNLGSGAGGTPTRSDDEHSARVYDVPVNAANQGPPAYAAPEYPSTQGGYTPSAPQYMQPRQDQQQAPMYQQPGMVMVQQSNTALVALILGLVSFLGLSILTAIPAIIVGRNARQEIQASRGMMTGEGMAQAGIILGWINIGLTLFGFCVFCAIPFLGILGASVGG